MAKVRHTVVPRVLCFVFYEDSVLLLKASKAKDWFGYLEPPGGHIEKGENIIKRAEKEIFEETNLKVKRTKLAGIVHVSGFFGKEIMLFVTKSIAMSKKVKGSYEGEPIWVSIKDLNRIKLLEDIKPILHKTLTLKKGEMFIGTSEFDGKDKLISLAIEIN